MKQVKSDLGLGIIDPKAIPPASSVTWHVQCLLETSRMCLCIHAISRDSGLVFPFYEPEGYFPLNLTPFCTVRLSTVKVYRVIRQGEGES